MLEQDRTPRAAPGHRREGYAKSRRTRAQILDAALAEASERGLHKTSVSRIASRANAAVGSLHYHFGSRNQLLREMMRRLMADLFLRLAAVDAGDGGDFFSRHRAELLAYMQYLRANPAHIRLVDEIKFLEPELYRQGVANWVDQIGAKLRAGVAEGSVRPMDEDEVVAQAHFLLGARHFLEEMLERDDSGRDAAVVDAYIRLVRDGLGSPGASGSGAAR